MYEEATKEPYSFLFIDGRQTSDSAMRFRGNIFLPHAQEVFVFTIMKVPLAIEHKDYLKVLSKSKSKKEKRAFNRCRKYE